MNEHFLLKAYTVQLGKRSKKKNPLIYLFLLKICMILHKLIFTMKSAAHTHVETAVSYCACICVTQCVLQLSELFLFLNRRIRSLYGRYGNGSRWRTRT